MCSRLFLFVYFYIVYEYFACYFLIFLFLSFLRLKIVFKYLIFNLKPLSFYLCFYSVYFSVCFARYFITSFLIRVPRSFFLFSFMMGSPSKSSESIVFIAFFVLLFWVNISGMCIAMCSARGVIVSLTCIFVRGSSLPSMLLTGAIDSSFFIDNWDMLSISKSIPLAVISPQGSFFASKTTRQSVSSS